MEIIMKNIGAINSFLIVLTLILSGCGPSNIQNMYSGPKLSSDQTVSIHAQGMDIRVISIDGQATGIFPYKSAFISLPGKHTLVLRKSSFSLPEQKSRKYLMVDSFEISFDAKLGFTYFVREMMYYENGDKVYSFAYNKLAADHENQSAIMCKDKLSINWLPNENDLRWVPYIAEYGQIKYLSRQVVDWDYKGVATQLNSSNEQNFIVKAATIEKQQKLAIDCMGEHAKNYFGNAIIYHFPPDSKL